MNRRSILHFLSIVTVSGLLSWIPITSFAQTATPTTPTTAPATISTPINLNVRIPGLTLSETSQLDTNGDALIPLFGQYIAGIYKYLLGISMIVGAIMIVYGGFLYIIGSSTSSVKRGREIITNTGIGLGLLFGIWTILYTINPDLVLLQPLRVQVIQPDKAHIEIVSPSSYEIPKTACEFEMNQAGIPTVLSLYKCAIDVVAKQTGIDPCYLVIGINNESYLALPNSIGHDEWPIGKPPGNQGDFYPGRLAFMKSGVTYSGKPITDPERQLNDDRPDFTKEDLGLDPRFSHGVGLLQFTVKSICGKSWSKRDLITPYTGILAGAEHIRCNLAKQNALETQQYPGTISMIWTLWGGCYSDGVAGKCPPFNKTGTIVPEKGRTKPTYACIKDGNPLSFINPSFFTICRGDLPLDREACKAYVQTELAAYKINPKTACDAKCYDSRMPVICGDKDKVCRLRNPSP